MECRMHRDGRLEYTSHETFSSLDYPFTAHPIKDGGDLIFNSYATDREVRSHSFAVYLSPLFDVISTPVFFFCKGN
jgi:hypothetical protein